MSTDRTKRALGAFALTLLLGTTAACGDDPQETRTVELSDTEHNDADVTFATDMMQHHAQALTMVDLTLERRLDPPVQRLAESIREAQGPEVEQFADWLTEWGEPVPPTIRDHQNADHPPDDMPEGMTTDMPGMMTGEDFEMLEDASDSDFQSRWLEMMIEHHTGAIEMAETEQQEGQFAPTVELAADIAASQADEITRMKELLGS